MATDPLAMPERLAADIARTVRPRWRRRALVGLLLVALLAVGSFVLSGCGGCGTYPAQVIATPTAYDGGTPRILLQEWGGGCQWWTYFYSWEVAGHYYAGEVLYSAPNAGGGGGGSW